MKSHHYHYAALLLAGISTAQAAPPNMHPHAHHGPAHHAQAHAPAGIMYEHVHPAGDWMVDYHVIQTQNSTVFRQSNEINEQQLQAAGFSAVPHEMTMQMHMLHVMYAPTDWLNVMLMPQFMSMDMSSTMTGGHGHGHDGHSATSGHHAHEVSGIGDTQISALFRLHQQGQHGFNAAFGLSAPTGSVDERGSDGRLLGYGMQLGTGTWDWLPTVTYTGSHSSVSWGAQVGAILPLENANDSGFRFGEQYHATSWAAYRPNHWLSVSLRLGYEKEGRISGHYDAAHNHASPADFQANYGGEFWDAGIGANVRIPSGPLAGQQLGIEWLEPIAEHYRGYQLGGRQTVAFRWSASF